MVVFCEGRGGFGGSSFEHCDMNCAVCEMPPANSADNDGSLGDDDDHGGAVSVASQQLPSLDQVYYDLLSSFVVGLHTFKVQGCFLCVACTQVHCWCQCTRH